MASEKHGMKIFAACVVGAILLAALCFGPGLWTRGQFVGRWDVAGSFADWQFDWNGDFAEKSLISTRGTYQLLSGNRIRIKFLTGPGIFRYAFKDDTVTLTGCDGTPFSFKLTKIWD